MRNAGASGRFTDSNGLFVPERGEYSRYTLDLEFSPCGDKFSSFLCGVRVSNHTTATPEFQQQRAGQGRHRADESYLQLAIGGQCESRDIVDYP